MQRETAEIERVEGGGRVIHELSTGYASSESRSWVGDATRLRGGTIALMGCLKCSRQSKRKSCGKNVVLFEYAMACVMFVACEETGRFVRAPTNKIGPVAFCGKAHLRN